MEVLDRIQDSGDDRIQDSGELMMGFVAHGFPPFWISCDLECKNKMELLTKSCRTICICFVIDRDGNHSQVSHGMI